MQNFTGMTCPFCQFPIKPNEKIIVCPSDNIPHHSECWTENGGCTTYGCKTTSSAAQPYQNAEITSVVSSDNHPLSINNQLDNNGHKNSHANNKWLYGTVIALVLLILLIGMLDLPASEPTNVNAPKQSKTPTSEAVVVEDEIYRSINWNGGTYIGEHKDEIPNGYGNWSHPSGDNYDGYFKDGQFSGHGVYTWADGRIYDGQWLNGKRHGSGDWKHPDGREYVGEWGYGMLDGQGTYTWPDGEMYVGQYVNDQKHGWGTWYYSDGRKYEGELKSGFPNGQGIMTYPNGDISDGNWNNGEFIDLHDLTTDYIVDMPYETGFYTGPLLMGLPNGHGEFYVPGKGKYIGGWVDGVPHGNGRVILADGSERFVVWNYGQVVGP